MSAVKVDYTNVGDVELVGAFYGLALAEVEGNAGRLGIPWAMGTPTGRAKMRLAFREIANRWLPDGLLDESILWAFDGEGDVTSLTLIRGGLDDKGGK